MFQPDGPVIKRTLAKKTFRAYFEIHPARRNFNFLECINFVGRTAASSGTNCREACIKDPARSSIKIFSELVVDRKRERKKKELWDVTRTDLHLAWISLHAAYAFPGFVSRDSILPDGFERLILRDIRQTGKWIWISMEISSIGDVDIANDKGREAYLIIQSYTIIINSNLLKFHFRNIEEKAWKWWKFTILKQFCFYLITITGTI